MNTYYLTVSLNQESRNSLARWFWAKISTVVADKMPAGAAVI